MRTKCTCSCIWHTWEGALHDHTCSLSLAHVCGCVWRLWATLGWNFTLSKTPWSLCRPWFRHDTGYYQQCHSSSVWGWSGRLSRCWPLWEGKASWWRGWGPDSLLRSCLEHRPEPACGLQMVSKEKMNSLCHFLLGRKSQAALISLFLLTFLIYSHDCCSSAQ